MAVSSGVLPAEVSARRDSPAIQLDLDGLLLDTELPQRPVYLRIFRDLCGVALSNSDFSWALGRSYEETVEGINERFGSLPLRPGVSLPLGQTLGEFVVDRLRTERSRERQAGGVEAMPFAREHLSWADSLKLPRSVSTSRKEEVAREMLQAATLLDRIHVLVGRNSPEVRLAKPAPDIFQVAAKRLCTPIGRCWALEDSPPGVLGASEAGAKVIYIPDERVAGPCGRSKRLAAFTVRNLEEATIILQRELGGIISA